MSPKKREPVFVELDALIASPFADVPQTEIPANWRAVIAERYDLDGLRCEAADAMHEIDLRAARSQEAIQAHALAATVAENEQQRQATAGLRAKRARRVMRPRKDSPTTRADRERELRERMQRQRTSERARTMTGARLVRWRQAS